MSNHVLKIHALSVCFPTGGGMYPAVENLSLSVKQGEIFGIVGESGCGKSLTALSVLRLLPEKEALVQGEIWVDGENVLQLSEKQMQRNIRSKKVSMIFQEPMTSLNPLLTVGEQIAEVLRVHKGMGKPAAWEEAIRYLKLSGIPDPAQRAKAYPHQLSGGQRQRVMIAIALCCQPKLLIADEPTTALDVTMQAQILQRMKTLQEETGTSIVMITHDLGVIAEMCHRVAVMYCGSIVEEGAVEDVLHHPTHPYTQGLLHAIPRLDSADRLLYSIPGTVPQRHRLPQGCRFADRCPHCKPVCRNKIPNSTSLKDGHWVRCFMYERSLYEA